MLYWIDSLITLRLFMSVPHDIPRLNKFHPCITTWLSWLYVQLNNYDHHKAYRYLVRSPTAVYMLNDWDSSRPLALQRWRVWIHLGIKTLNAIAGTTVSVLIMFAWDSSSPLALQRWRVWINLGIKTLNAIAGTIDRVCVDYVCSWYENDACGTFILARCHRWRSIISDVVANMLTTSESALWLAECTCIGVTSEEIELQLAKI